MKTFTIVFIVLAALLSLIFPRAAQGAIYTVTNTLPGGGGSFDWAISQANANPGLDNINFNILLPFPGPYTIQPPPGGFQALWDQAGVTIDGYTQPGAVPNTAPQGQPSNAVLMIELDGSPFWGQQITGLYMASSNNVVRGLVINSFWWGIVIDGFSGGGAIMNRILGCYIGTDVSGTQDDGCWDSGIYTWGGARNNFVGDGTDPGRNLCSGSDFQQIGIVGGNTDFNFVLGNFIGTELNGQAAIGNVGTTGAGVCIYSQEGGSPKHNEVGRVQPGERNIISGNPWVGVEIAGIGTDFNLVRNNYIGTDVTGTVPVGNGTAGVYILDGAAWNIVGGATVAHRNVISNNNWGAWGCGVDIDDGAHDNVIENNYIGTDVGGQADHGNLRNGVHIVDGSPDNTVRNNLIYWNRVDQVRIEGAGSDRNLVEGNSLGRTRVIVDINQSCVGVHILAAAQNNVIGTAVAPNVIELNTAYGVEIEGSNTDYNLFQGNTIRDNAYWNMGGYGVYIHGGAQHNDIGPGNTIYNNTDGVRVDGLNTIYNRITQNDIYGSSGKAIETINGGNMELPPPFISSALPTGVSGGTQPPLPLATVDIFSDHADECSTFSGFTQTDMVGNFSWSGSAIGPNVTATVTDAAGNTSECSSPAYFFVVVNTNDAGYGSLRQAILNANAFTGPNTITTRIPTSDPNYDAAAGIWTIRVQSPLPTLTDNGTTIEASQQWVEIDGSGSAGLTGNGFTIASSLNVIKGYWYITRFTGHGIEMFGGGATGNQILDCYVGCALTSPYDRGNGQHGVYVHGGANSNTIGDASGGLTPGGIVVAGNDSCGVCIRGSGSTNNTIVRAYIGYDIFGTAVGNSVHGVLIDDGARQNQVGGSGPVLWNWIIYNGQYGICITDADNNTVSSNEIGFYSKVQPNGSGGIRIDGGSQGNTIGGLSPAQGNIICGNHGPGVTLSGSGTSNNTVQNCWIGLHPDGLHALGNTGDGILMENGASANTVGGTTTAARNVISGNSQCGILLREASTSGNTIKGNYVGTDTSGTAAVANGVDGIQIRAQASGNTIGGPTSASRNIISGNTGNGITVKGSGSNSQTISENYIGLNKNGANLYNHGNGLSLVDSCANHTVRQNNISGNLGDGVYGAFLTAGNTLITQNTIASNSIGIHLFYCKVSAVSMTGNTIYSNSLANIRIDSPIPLKSARESVASESTIRGNTLYNSPYGIHVASVDAFRHSSDKLEKTCLSTDPLWIHFNNLSDHTEYGMFSDDPTSTVHAENNWWGHNSGPYHPEENPDGEGDAVSDYIEFDPWLGNQSAVCVTAGEDVEVGPGGTAKVTFTIRSEVAQTYDIWVSDSLGWPYDPTYLVLFLNAGEEQSVTIDVTAAGDVPPGTRDKVTLTAVAQASDPPDQSWDWLMVTVTECVKGDVNGDGVINILDALRVVNIILEVGDPPSEAELCAADCNGDENINVLDVLGIVNVILGIIPECPGSAAKIEIHPEALKFLESLQPYFSPYDFARFMAMVREVQIPDGFALHQNFPNPFNPTTSIQFAVGSGQSTPHITLKLFNVMGQEVATLVDEVKEPGYYTVTWDASDMPSGVYFYRLTAGEMSETRRMVLMK